MSKKFTVDVPPRNPSSWREWHNVNTFLSREAALAYVKKWFGADDQGRVCLIKEVDSNEAE